MESFNPFDKSAEDVKKEKEEIEKWTTHIMDDLHLLAEENFPEEILNYIKNKKGDNDERQYSSEEKYILLKKLIDKSEITRSDLPTSRSGLEILHDSWLKQMKYKVFILGTGYDRSDEMKNNLDFIQSLVNNKGWKGFYNYLNDQEGSAVSDIWAEHESGWIVLNETNIHQLIEPDFDFSIFEKSERKF